MLVFVAAADYVFQWWSFEKKLKMSKQEVKDEYKQLEGDPQIKGKIKRKQQEMAQQRMMQEVRPQMWLSVTLLTMRLLLNMTARQPTERLLLWQRVQTHWH